MAADRKSLRPDGRFHAVAHRGAPSRHRENTLPGIDHALSAGADLVEVDIKITADGEVVLLHDLGLERLWRDPRRITEIGSTELSGIGDAAHRIPKLSEALIMVGLSTAAIMIDMDDPRWARPASAVVADAVRAGVLVHDQVSWCGRPDTLSLIRESDPDARIVFSWDESDSDGRLPADSLITDLAPEAFNPHWPMLLDEGGDAVFDWIAGHGLASCCWTVDDPRLMRQLLDRGVNAMITNQIDTLQELRPR
jgi:glycerophosphoryl diester phosphodiesterase